MSKESKSSNNVERTSLLTAKQLARYMNVSLRHVRRLDSAGKLPKPVRLGHSVRWPISEIEKFIEMGCPNRRDFETRRRG